jgi:hypothetical protein
MVKEGLANRGRLKLKVIAKCYMFYMQLIIKDNQRVKRHHVFVPYITIPNITIPKLVIFPNIYPNPEISKGFSSS